jgi:hypothetical protein
MVWISVLSWTFGWPLGPPSSIVRLTPLKGRVFVWRSSRAFAHGRTIASHTRLASDAIHHSAVQKDELGLSAASDSARLGHADRVD